MTGDPAVYSIEAGAFVSSKLQRLAEIISDYDPNLELRWIPPQNRTFEDSLPYCIMEVRPDKRPQPIFYFGEDADVEVVLAKIFTGDNKNGNVLKKIEAQDAAAKVFQLKNQMDEAEEAADMARFLMRSPKNMVVWKDRTTGEKVKLDELRRRKD